MVTPCTLTRIDAGAKLSPDGEPPTIVIDEIIHIGRSDRVVDHMVRSTPTALHDATFALQIQPLNAANPIVSRNHCLIYPPTSLTSPFLLCDLNSMNGTFVNNARVLVNNPVELAEGDKISLAFDPGALQFNFNRMQAGASDHHALMIGHFGGNLRGTTRDVDDLSDELGKRGFAGNIKKLIDGQATKEKILGMLEHVRLKIGRNSTFVFYFSGHGSSEAELVVQEKNTSARLKASELFALLKTFRGNILVILDGCHTQSFIGKDLPDSISLIGHSGRAYEGDTSVAVPPRLETNAMHARSERIRGYTTRAVVKALQSTPHRIQISAIFEAIQKDPRILARQQVVHRPSRIDIEIASVLAPRRSDTAFQK